MPRIQQLPPSVVTKIAAGEVIERPASVVKELLENSLDAGANRIEIDVEAGGVEGIRVVDNGCGIAADDLPLAFASHATSKLQTADDLFQIATLGFRGEALASVGGVAQVALQSRVPGTPHGAEVTCHGGDLSPVRAWNGAAGTRVEVRHLFYNTPVRRKFLRSTGTEMGHVCETFTRLALSHPTVHWVLRHNGKLVYEVPATAGLAERVGLFFGAELRDHLYDVVAKEGVARLHGYIADPSCERGNAKMQYLFVNGRWVRDRTLAHALQEGYRGLLMTGRYAVAFLFLDLPPDQVDVNVHPTKAEVRFRDGNALHHLVFAAVRERLRAENLTPRLQVTPGIAAPPTAPAPTIWALPPEQGPPPLRDPPRTNDNTEPVGNALRGVPPDGTTPQEATGTPPAGVPTMESVAAEAERHGGRSLQKVIQLYDCYLVLETPEGMLVIDQHALHERILFEQLKRRLRSGPLETQRLLIPEPVELTAEQAARALDQRAALAELGLGIEDFGGGTVLLTSYPAILGRRSPRDVLKAVVDHLMSKDCPPSREVLLNDLLSLMACHSAVRAGDRLGPEEIAALLEQRQLADDTHHCPHGRPTALLFSRHDLERQFRRV
jgi:DNA mismatch repair protein MutL